MKKTFTINISGSVFHIDEDAYEKLKSYLQMLNSHFGTDPDGREILQDIESRISELFREQMEAEKKDVIVANWVDAMIERMGQPEDFLEDEESAPASSEEKTEAEQPARTRRRMYRDPDHRVLGGVLSGMGAYFNIDPVLLRIIYFILFWVSMGVALPVYILFWIAIPKARTTAQKLEMRGQEATVSNIEKSFREEVKEVKESYHRLTQSDPYNKGKDRMARLGDMLYNMARVVLKATVVVIGALLIIGAFVGLVGFLSTIIIGGSFMHSGFIWVNGFSLPTLFKHFISPGALTISMVAITLLVAIPILSLLFLGTKLVFRYKTNNKLIFLSGLGLWLVALVTIISVSLGQLVNFSDRTTLTQTQPVDCQNCQTLFIELGDDVYRDYTDSKIHLDNMKMIVVDGKEVLLGKPRLDVEKSSNNEFSVLIRKKARGKDQENAREHIDEISYNFALKDSVIRFDPHFLLKESSKWRSQELNITVKVPEGKNVFLHKNTINAIYNIENVSNTWGSDMVDKTWKMTDHGLELIQ